MSQPIALIPIVIFAVLLIWLADFLIDIIERD